MGSQWYSQNKKELQNQINEFLTLPNIQLPKKINGAIVPHAGYIYSGSVAGKAYAVLSKFKPKKAIILAPSHYIPLQNAYTHTKSNWQTPLGTIKVSQIPSLPKLDISEEHAIDNQIPFLQTIGVNEISPIIIGNINESQINSLTEKIKDFKGIIIVSTDLSHFLPYSLAKTQDNQTIKAIEELNDKDISKIDACGIYPLLVFMKLARLNDWQPTLLEYKNSGDITNEKNQVVGYASFIF